MPKKQSRLSRKEAIIRQYKRGEMSSNRAGQLLNITDRQVRRLNHVLTERGTLAHGGRGHEAANRVEDDVEQAILTCFDANPKRNNQQVVDLLAEDGVTTNRMTVKRVLERNNRKKEANPPPAFIRFEKDAIGEVVYQDTSDHEWMLGSGQRVRCIASQDDHSRKILAAKFFNHDGVWQNMIILRRVVEHFGLPQTFFVDRASHFSGNERRSIYVVSKHPEHWEIQIKRAVESLGVILSRSRAYHPQSKGKLERLFGFMQGRLPHELKTDSLVEANKHLTKWIYWHNTKHKNRTTGMTPERRWTLAKRNKRSLFVPLPAGINLDDAFSFHDQRTIAKDNTFSYQGQTYRLEGVGGQYIGKRVDLHILPPRTIRVFWLNTFVYELKFKGEFKQPLD